MDIQTVNIALPSDLMQKVDALAKKEYRNRSELIREALRRYINNSEKWEELFTYGQSIGKKLEIKSETDITQTVASFRHEKKSR